MRFTRMHLLICFTLFLSISGKGQPLAFDLLAGKEKIDIPFHLENGFILLDVTLANTLTLNFIFDTGAENIILFQKFYGDLLQFEYDKKITLHGADLSEDISALVARKVNIGIEGKVAGTRDILILEENSMNIHKMMGTDIHGILGGSFFRGLVIKINYKKRKLTLYDPNLYVQDDPDYTEIDLEVKSNKPYIVTDTQLTPNHSVKTRLLLDTGAAIPFILHANTDTSITMPSHLMIGVLGEGLGGLILGFKGKIHNLQFGRFQFPNILTAYQDVDDRFVEEKKVYRNGLIGNNLLARFDVIIDFLRAKLYLKPNKKYNKEFEYDRSGLIVFAVGENFNNFIINAVIHDSPGHLADIRVGDRIKKVCLWKSRWWTLGKINKLFTQKKGKRIKLVIERNGVEIKKEFRLDDYFNVDGAEVR